MFLATSTSIDEKGKVFVASMEAHKYPFYGTLFHPEKG
jgi:anthranilate/para-aminobenzoate synthase component II